jgi:hypothetical protein
MNVTTVKATLRLSRETGQGWATAEVGAEATLEPGEDWQEAQEALYVGLKARLVHLFVKTSQERGSETVTAPSNGAGPAQRPPLVPVQPAHYCVIHEKDFQERRKGPKTWWSHRTTDGWCNEN